jgi:hypothetical protein
MDLAVRADVQVIIFRTEHTIHSASRHWNFDQLGHAVTLFWSPQQSIFSLTSIIIVVYLMTSLAQIIWPRKLRRLMMITSRDSSVGIATGYGLDDRGSISGRNKFFLSAQRPDRQRGPLWLLSMSIGGISLGVNLSVGETDQSPPLLPRSKIMELHLHSPTRLHGIVSN